MLPKPIYFGRYDSVKALGNKKVHVKTTQMTLIEMFTEDSGTVTINGEYHEIKKGNLLFTKLGDVRRYTTPFKTKFVYFRDIDNELSEMLSTFPNYISQDLTDELSDSFEKVFDYLTSEIEYAEIYASTALMELICKIKTMQIQQYNSLMHSKNTTPISKAMYFINQNYSKHITVDDISAACGLSVSYLHKRFLEMVNMTPGAYLNRVRISAAKRLLMSTDDSTEIIADKCGFSSQTYFTTAFKKITNTTPQKYRKSVRYPI